MHELLAPAGDLEKIGSAIVTDNKTIVLDNGAVTFKDFGTADFSSFMRSMVESERFKILSINMTKIKETNLLQGTMKLMHLGQNAVDPIQE